MQLNWNRTFKTRKGQPIVFDQESKKPITAGDCCIIALDNEEVRIDGTQKYRRYELSRKIEKAVEIGQVEFTAEELVILKQAVGEFPFIGILHGQLWDFLDNKAEESANELRIVG